MIHTSWATAGRTHHLNPSVGLWIPVGVPHSARFDPEALILAMAFRRHFDQTPGSYAREALVTTA